MFPSLYRFHSLALQEAEDPSVEMCTSVKYVSFLVHIYVLCCYDELVYILCFISFLPLIFFAFSNVTDGKQGVQFYTQIKTVTSSWQYSGSDLGGATMPILGKK